MNRLTPGHCLAYNPITTANSISHLARKNYDTDYQNVGTLQVVFGDGRPNISPSDPVLPLLSNFITAGYLNGDGFADLGSLYGDDLAILLRKGDGTFASPVNHLWSLSLSSLGRISRCLPWGARVSANEQKQLGPVYDAGRGTSSSPCLTCEPALCQDQSQAVGNDALIVDDEHCPK